MNKEELLTWAEEQGFNPELQKKYLLNCDYCDHGDDIGFIDSEKKAEIVTAHNIESFIKGMRYARENCVGRGRKGERIE